MPLRRPRKRAEPGTATAPAPALPVFLRGMTWVDLGAQDDTGIQRLIWGITGRKPGFSSLDEPLE